MNSLSLIGMSKNSGKTTVLNTLLSYYYSRGIPLGLTSIGRDGEDRDIVTDTGKPRIYVEEGTLFATTASLFRLCDVSKELLQTTGINTPLGEVLIIRARSAGYVQLAGPSINAQLADIFGIMERYGAQTILVDGAFARKTNASPAITGKTILCTGASLDKNMHRVIEETRHVHDLLVSEKAAPELERIDKGFPLAIIKEDGSSDGLEQAALTDAAAEDLMRQGLRNAVIIADDASKFLLGPEIHSRLELRKIKLMVRRSTRLLAVTINPVSARDWEFDAAEFKNALAALIKTPVINVMEEKEKLYDLLV